MDLNKLPWKFVFKDSFLISNQDLSQVFVEMSGLQHELRKWPDLFGFVRKTIFIKAREDLENSERGGE